MATTWPVISARLTSLTVSQGYGLTRDPFSFELQPDTALDDVCRITGALEGYDGYLGRGQAERWTATVWLARKGRMDVHSAQRALYLSIDSLTAAVAADSTAGDYLLGDDIEAEVQVPGEELGYVVASVSLPIELERSP